jgi:hypothetical protein
MPGGFNEPADITDKIARNGLVVFFVIRIFLNVF